MMDGLGCYFIPSWRINVYWNGTEEVIRPAMAILRRGTALLRTTKSGIERSDWILESAIKNLAPSRWQCCWELIDEYNRSNHQDWMASGP